MTTITVGDCFGVTRGVFIAITRMRSAQVGFSLERQRVILGVLQFHDLQELCRPGANPRLATVESWAKREGIAYRYDGKGGIWTTQDALNTALGIRQAANSDHQYAPEDIG